MRSGRERMPSDDILSVTAWMFGVFASQLAIGNTSFNKLLSVCRNPLDVLKSSGQRIFVRTERGWELLGLPSAFEMGPTSARWVYHDEERTFGPDRDGALDAPVCRLMVEVAAGRPDRAARQPRRGRRHATSSTSRPQVAIDVAGGRVELRPAPGGTFRERYPEATFWIVSPDADRIESIGRDGLLYADGVDRGGAHIVVKTKPVTPLHARLDRQRPQRQRAKELATDHGAEAGRRPDQRRRAVPRRDRLVVSAGTAREAGRGRGRFADDVARLDDVLRWFVHDGMIHYTTPHGLEQYSGAAWGLRDVCQGPVEMLVATGNLGPLRDVLRIVYEHQFRRTGDWPQWFMFDRYREVQAAESHADIIHWPIKALCDYIEASGDLSILDEAVAYTDDRTMAATTETETIFAHTERQIATIERDCIPGTALPDLRRRRLGGHAPARGPGDGRAPGQRLDRRAGVPDARALPGGVRTGGSGRHGEAPRRAVRPDPGRFPAPPRPRRRSSPASPTSGPTASSTSSTRAIARPASTTGCCR